MDRLAAFENDLLEAWQRCMAHEQIVDLCLADRTVRFRIKGDACLLDALCHAQIIESETPIWTVYMIDASDTSCPMPSVPWTLDAFGRRTEVANGTDERRLTSFNIDSGILTYVEVVKKIAIVWIRSRTAVPMYERAAPLRHFFNRWAVSEGLMFLHAGAIAQDGRALLLAGRGGSGKSTTAFLAMQGGWNFLADDYCIVDPSEPPVVYRVYSTCKLTHSANDWIGYEDARQISDPDKIAFFLNDTTLSVPGRADIRSIVLPAIGKEALLTPTSAVSAMRALAPSTLLQSAGAGRDEFRRISDLVRRIPAVHLHLVKNRRAVLILLNQILQLNDPIVRAEV